MRLVWVVIPLVLIVSIIGIFGVQESNASCIRNTDWPTPCFDQGIFPDEKELREIWHGYYEHKGSAFMELKKTEMFQAVENEKFKEWVYDGNYPFVHYNVYSYYLSIGEITNQFPVKRGGYMGNVGVSEQNSSSLDVDVPDNPKQSQEKIVITMIPNSSNPYACDPSIPPYDKPNCFLPAIAHVNIGQLVVFENSKPSVTMIASGNPQHGPDGIFESPPIPPGSSYEISFDKEGIYNYFDFVAPWMAGTIIVGTSTTNLPPVANAGQNKIIVEGKSVQLSIVGDDPENGKFRYSWQQISGPTVKLSNVYYPEGPISNDYPYLHTASKTTYFTAPNVYATTSFVFEGTVIDNTLQRATDTVQITIVDDFSSKSYPIAITEDFDELDKALEDAKEKLETVMSSGDGTITINMLFVDGVNHMLVVGITPSEDVLSIEEYKIRIKAIVGDIPMNVGFASFVEEDILLVKKILPPLKQIENSKDCIPWCNPSGNDDESFTQKMEEMRPLFEERMEQRAIEASSAETDFRLQIKKIIESYEGKNCNLSELPMNCFVNSFNNCTGAILHHIEYSTEGDPLLKVIKINSSTNQMDCSVDGLYDYTADTQGSGLQHNYTCQEVKLDEYHPRLRLVQCIEESSEVYWDKFW